MNLRFLVITFGEEDVKFFEDLEPAFYYARNHEGELYEFNYELREYYKLWDNYECFE